MTTRWPIWPPAIVVTPGITYNLWNLSSFDQITLANVAQLTVQWTLAIGVLEEFQAPPLVVGNTMYIVAPVNEPDGVGQARSSSRSTSTVTATSCGSSVPDVDREGALTACCGDQTRGLHYAEGKIFFHTLDGQVFALDAETGEPLWRSVGADVTIREHAPGNGIVIGDLYIIGNEGGESGVRGKVSAFDINTGQTQWVMYNEGPNNEVGIGPRFNPQYAYMQMRQSGRSTPGTATPGAVAAARRGATCRSIPSGTCSSTAPAIAARGTRTIAANGAW